MAELDILFLIHFVSATVSVLVFIFIIAFINQEVEEINSPPKHDIRFINGKWVVLKKKRVQVIRQRYGYY